MLRGTGLGFVLRAIDGRNQHVVAVIDIDISVAALIGHPDAIADRIVAVNRGVILPELEFLPFGKVGNILRVSQGQTLDAGAFLIAFSEHIAQRADDTDQAVITVIGIGGHAAVGVGYAQEIAEMIINGISRITGGELVDLRLAEITRLTDLIRGLGGEQRLAGGGIGITELLP